MSFSTHKRDALDPSRPMNHCMSHVRSCAMLMGQKYRVPRSAIIERVKHLCGIDVLQLGTDLDARRAVAALVNIKNCGLEVQMEIHEARLKVQSFAPTGDEAADCETLYALLEDIGEARRDPDVRRALIGIFERHPAADLGSPGPIVHALEESPLDEQVALLADSLDRSPTQMVMWMSDRCFRSPNITGAMRDSLTAALTRVRDSAEDRAMADAAAESLRSYGT